jgi:intracellular septation protein A
MSKQAKMSKPAIIREVILSVGINGLLPLLAYNLLTPHLSEIEALTLVSLIPLADNLVSFLRHRRLDVFGLFMLAGLLLSLGVVLLGGDQKFILIKESFLTGAIGLVMLASLVLPRPLLFYFAAHFTAGKSQEAQAEFGERWHSSYFRFVMYLMTIVWGLALVAEAAIRIVLVLSLNSTTTFLAVSPLVQYAITGGTIAWTVWYARYSSRKVAQLRHDPSQSHSHSELKAALG